MDLGECAADLLHEFAEPFDPFRPAGEGSHVAEKEELPVLGPPTDAARDLAMKLVTLAKAEALTTLGEQHQGLHMVEEWLRSTRF